jgi:hypothetical protein
MEHEHRVGVTRPFVHVVEACALATADGDVDIVRRERIAGETGEPVVSGAEQGQMGVQRGTFRAAKGTAAGSRSG